MTLNVEPVNGLIVGWDGGRIDILIEEEPPSARWVII